MKGVVCFDIGGTGVKYGLVNEEGIFEQGSFPTDRSNGQTVLDQMENVIETFKSNHEVEGVSISSPGFVNCKTGQVIAGNIINGFNGLNLRDYFKEKTGLPLAIENDANCAAIAEHDMGNGRGYENVAVVTLGTGVGGGLILNDKIYSGNHCMAGEFGFMFTKGLQHALPEHSILSGYASTRALCDMVKNATMEDLDGVEIYERAAKGDPVIRKILDYFYNNIAMGLYNICYTVDPDLILIGGGISKQPELIEKVKEKLTELKPSFSVDLNDVVKIDTCKFFNDAGLIGAYCNFKNMTKEQG